MGDERLAFQVEARAAGTRARAGVLRTRHGTVQTPVFMPVGTQGTVKAQRPEDLTAAGSRILLANTYHLLLRPGPEVMESFGGLHRFMQWEGGLLTDSGGFQIFSLPNARIMREEGALFRSYVDGREYLLSPEVSIGTQRAIGSDIMMALDQCIPSTADRGAARAALEITNRWALRSLAARGDSWQALFGIVQGALFPDLRRESAAAVTDMPFDGFAIGGLAVGEGRPEREEVCALTADLLPPDKPRYLMGVGTPVDLLEAVHRGVDMFDCIIPTQVSQRGTVFTRQGILQLRRSAYRFSEEPIEADCGCPACTRWSRGYLHHLTKTQETLGWQLMGLHNIWFYHRLMRDIRESIVADRFPALYQSLREVLTDGDGGEPQQPRRQKRRSRTLGVYEAYEQPAGFWSIRHRESGEIMHSRTPPMEEAQALYSRQSALAERLAEEGPPLVIWDVGLGAAANAMAAVQCYESLAAAGVPVRELHLVSFENDLDALRLARRWVEQFTWLQHAGPAGLLTDGEWRSRTHPGLHWSLREGDFRESMAGAPPPDLVFYDMFSWKSDGESWTLEAFRQLREACGDRAVELFTYTNSTAIRAALLASGFHVARGVAVGVKDETTVGLTEAAVAGKGSRFARLDQAWREKWRRSGAPFPPGLPEAAQAEVAGTIEGHPQFRGAEE